MSLITPSNREGARSTSGFTLIELLVVLVIMPMVIGAIALGLVAVFHLQSSVSQRLSGSADLQQVSAQFTKDVQNSETIYLGSSSQQCPVTSQQTQLLGLMWNSKTTMISYVSTPMTNNSTDFALERLFCTLNNSGSWTVGSTKVLSSDFYVNNSLIKQSPPEVCVTNLEPQNCYNATTGSPSYDAHTVAAVMFTLYVPMSTSPYTLVASPRGGTAPNAGNGAAPMLSGLTLLGSCPPGSNQSVLQVGNGAGLTLTVDGAANSGTLGLSNCPASAVSISNNGSITGAGVYTGYQNSPGVTCGSGGGSPPPGTVCPTNVNYNPQLCNYFETSPTGPQCAGIPSNPLTPPPTTASQQWTGQCPQTYDSSTKVTTFTCAPGEWTALQTFTPTHNKASIHIVLTGNDATNGHLTVFDNDFIIPNGASVQFDPGTFVFAANDSRAFTTGTTASGIIDASSGVLLYVPKGSMKFSNNVTVNVDPIVCNQDGSISPAPLPAWYKGVDIWLGGGGAQSAYGVLTLGNNSTTTSSGTSYNNYGGIYVPYGQVVDLNNGQLNVAFIMAGSANFSAGTTQLNVNSPSSTSSSPLCLIGYK